MRRELEAVAADLDLAAADLIPYGHDKAKIRLETLARPGIREPGSLVLVSAMSPSPAGEGKTTLAIALADALRRLGRRSVVAVREPSLGPLLGVKGAGIGGGHSHLVPSRSISLHFTGDLHAVTSAHNLLSAALDNHLHHGNELDLDLRRAVWSRALDQNDRALRKIVVGLGGRTGGYPREDRFCLTAASEVMALLAIARDPQDLRQRLARLVLGLTRTAQIVRAGDLQADEAMAVLLEDALLPNLVQTAEGTPALVHTGPFANLAHGTSSLLATRVGLRGAEFVVQEAGFGADLGGEKFLNIFCRLLGQTPSSAVLVVTLRAVHHHGGLANVLRQLEVLRGFGLTRVAAALNEVEGDSPEELEEVHRQLEAEGHPTFRVRPFQDGGRGALGLAEWVSSSAVPAPCTFTYDLKDSLRDKLTAIATRVYGAGGIELSPEAARQLEDCERFGHGNAFVCMAKTQYSFSHDPKLRGVPPAGFSLAIREIHLSGGANFVVPICGEISTMPGLPRKPNFQHLSQLLS